MSRKRQAQESSESSQESQDFSQSPILDQIPTKKNQRERRKNVLQRNYMQQYSEGEPQQDQGSSQAEQYIYFKGGRVSKVIASRKREGTNQIQRLCKFHSKSYLHVQWLTEEDIKTRNIQMLKQTKRTIEASQKNLEEIQDKYGKDHFFNPSYIKVDRVLSTAVLFPAMHHKKGSEMNGKWSQMMMLVCSKILNFEKDNIPYGIIEKDDHHVQEQQELDKERKIKLEHVINRLYLGIYTSPQQFWKDVGECITTLINVTKNTGQQKDGEIVKQCAVFLFWQWFNLCKQKFLSQLPKQEKYDNIRNGLQNSDNSNNFKISTQRSDNQFSFNDLLNQNIFVQQGYNEKPATEQELLLLHPGKYHYQWLSSSSDMDEINYFQTTFHHLEEADLRKLDLNVPIDSLYLIKWCDLDYDQVTWEKQSDLKCFELLQNYKQFSKIPPKKERARMEENKKYHRAILNSMMKSTDSNQNMEVVDKCKRKLYNLYQNSKQIKQYGGDDIPVYKDYKLLKPFQLEGLNWLITSWHQRKNCILADEMGLGKTIQTIAFLNHLTVYEQVLGPFLIVAPVSTLKQWRNQIEQWSDLNCVLYKGKLQVRDRIQEYQFYHKFVTHEGIFVKFQKLVKFQVLLINYEIFVSDIEKFQKIPFQQIIMDEAHKMKNSKSKIAQALKLLPCPRIILLTGTPIQNNTSQIFGLLNVIEPRKFNSLDDFKKKFGLLKTMEELAQLKQVLKPYLLRRVKSDVQKSIPKLSEMLVNLELTKIQKAYYRGILQKNKNNLINSLNSTAINNISQCLRQTCNHPYMLSSQTEDELSSQCINEQERLEKFISCSSKMIFIHKFLTKCKQTKTKTLIFTQFLNMMELLRFYCSSHKIQFQSLDGGVNYQERQSRIDRFNKNPQVIVFIISTKAGGVGINLTSATNIIIYDSDWNPQNDIQAIARAHRIGQLKNVSVYRLITTNTYEDILYKTAVKKLGIGLAILDNEYFNNKVLQGSNKKQKSRQQIEKLLRDGVLGFLKNEDVKDDNQNIENQSIEDIISKSCTTVDYQTKDCSFSQAKFQCEPAQDNNINMNDPKFWQVALENVQSPLQKLVKKLKDEQLMKKIFESSEEQCSIMIEANEVVYAFVKSKVSMSHYNAQDQRQLRLFLEKISYSRQFLKAYKTIANDWLEEIEKPSRRFQKLDLIKITEVINKKPDLPPPAARIARRTKKASQIDQEKQNPSQNSKVRTNRKKTTTIQSSQSLSEDQKSETSGQQDNESKSKQKLQLKRSQRTTKKSKNPKQDEEIEQQEEQKSSKKKKGDVQEMKPNQYLERLCAFCERKFCSKLCKGLCHKSYHQLCYERFKSQNQVRPSITELQQFGLSQDEICKKAMQQFECFECEKGIGCCLICGVSGKVVPTAWQKPPKKPTQESSDSNSKNQINKIVQKASQVELKQVFGCRMASCSRVYHLKCLQLVQKQLLYQIYSIKSEGSYPIKCPSHFCSLCGNQLLRFKCSCLRCPVSYHAKCRNTKSQSLIQISCDFICKVHMTAEEIEKKKEELGMFSKINFDEKKEKIEQKRLEKQQKQVQVNIREPGSMETADTKLANEISNKVCQAFQNVEEAISKGQEEHEKKTEQEKQSVSI